LDIILNLNNYIKCDKEDAVLEIVPHINPDGIQMPSMYFKSTRAKRFVLTIDNMDVSVWHLDATNKGLKAIGACYRRAMLETETPSTERSDNYKALSVSVLTTTAAMV